MIAWPVVVAPVTEIIATSLWATSALPRSSSPDKTLSNPFGNPDCTASSAIRSAVLGVDGAGFKITALPAASAGPNFQMAIINGKFQGAIEPTIPIGRLINIDV